MIIFMCGALTIQSRNPEIGDNYIVDLSTNILKAMDGTVHSTIKTPAAFKHKIVLTNLTQVKVEEYKNFINTCVASEIIYIDKDNQRWVGYFTNTEFETITNGNGAGLVDTRKEVSTLTLDFEGIKE